MSDIIRLALKARIPIIRITSDDPVNIENLLSSLSDREVRSVTMASSSPQHWKPGTVYYDSTSRIAPGTTNYDKLLEQEITLIVVNPSDGEWPEARDCGALVPSIDYLKSQLSGWLSQSQVDKMGRYFAGMSLKDTVETVLITQARDGALSPNGVNETKSYLGVGMAGLESLDAAQLDYVPPDWAIDWLKVEAPLLEDAKYRELWPKGFMLHGPSGTGKTELSLFVARQLKWPLYRLDLGSLYSRWQGESERNLRKVLTFISGQGECVFLLDEAEKLFGNEAVGQASLSTLLSMLLWWLQGETNRTITVMTSNNLSVIPPELYRPGRLDSVHEMLGLASDELPDFVAKIAGRMAKQFGLDAFYLSQTVIERYSDLTDGTYVSQASVVDATRKLVKRIIVEGQTNAKDG